MAAEMKVTALLLAVLLAGCVEQKPQPDWMLAPSTHVCTDEQMTRVQRDHMFCKENTSYFSSACYGMAIERNCVHRDRMVPYKDPRNHE